LVHVIRPVVVRGGEFIESRAINIAAHARLEVHNLSVLVVMRMDLGWTYHATVSAERTVTPQAFLVAVISIVLIIIIAFVIICLLFAVTFVLFFLALVVWAVMLEEIRTAKARSLDTYLVEVLRRVKVLLAIRADIALIKVPLELV
jgi:hypothetical protein